MKNRKAIIYAADMGPLLTIEEQLRLFAQDTRSPSTPRVLTHSKQRMSKRERLVALLQGELNFHGEDSSYASHDLHAFAAKFPPQLPRAFIRALTSPGDIVLDPMMGSGTTVVEALLEGRIGIGLDIDPLALRLGQAKTMTPDLNRLRSEGNKVLVRANHLLSKRRGIEEGLVQYFQEETKAFVDYWFLPNTQRELMALLLAIKDIRGVST